MAIKDAWTNSSTVKYYRAIRSAPREVICSRHLILSAIVYATTAVPATWDQGSASVIPSLPGFQKQFDISSGTDAQAIKNFVSIVYIGYAVGAALSFLINDRIGRLWAYRLYVAVWAIGQFVGVGTPTIAGLYASRIITGLGIGALTVTGPMSIVEIAPWEIRGLLASWFGVGMALALFSSIFCVYGVYLHMPADRLQYQTVFFAPCIFMLLCVIGSFWIRESPRWLVIVDRHADAMAELSRLRGLPMNHSRLVAEFSGIEESIRTSGKGASLLRLARETLTVSSNLRRVQQSLLSYALAQLSGANSITSYFVPIMKILGLGKTTKDQLFLSGMYGFSKFFFVLIASFFFIDALGRRKSLFVGITLQMITHIYLSVYIRESQLHDVSDSASQGAIALIFIHAFGYCVGLFILPYVFGGELWPNHIRSFGSALGQTFHWLFIYAMSYGTPSLLATTNQWGAFVFFAAWCFVALCYVYFMVPELSGLSVEQINDLFKGPWFSVYKRSKRSPVVDGVEAGDSKGNTDIS
ncbi:hypothetical protein N7492_008380 [Penicillium capsulatum]|uniref:Major facilitator superfamily (MFS) profile domain-containing protein n=1 Tax=Penicillium capsulatum TaxID=69766 RepID=A0A9W9LH11_9EURO|nr:hypothetical protein N7492_008380 [Penicillium capsulatum]KAJ6105782.1 hypothetical protein N7512_009299 [Penicillium capsulatum]